MENFTAKIMKQPGFQVKKMSFRSKTCMLLNSARWCCALNYSVFWYKNDKNFFFGSYN